MVRDFWDTLHMQQFFFHVKEVSVSEHQNCFWKSVPLRPFNAVS